MDFYEGAYSGGKKVASENGFVSLVEAENTGSYFVDLDSSKERLFQSIIDVNNDGLSDIVCGSSDGKLYVYETIGFDTRWKCKDPKILKATLSSGVPENAHGVLGCLTNVIRVYPAPKL